MSKPTSEREGAFEFTAPARPTGELIVAPDAVSGTLLSFVDTTGPSLPEPEEIPDEDVPERIVLASEETAMQEAAVGALKSVVKAFNMVGKNAGRDTTKKTGGNQFQTRYASQQGNSPDLMTDQMDGKKIGLMISVGLAKSKRPESEKTIEDKRREAEGRRVIDTLSDAPALVAAGEPPEVVDAYRDRFATLLARELRPDPEHRVNANYRNGLYKNPEKGMLFLSNLRMRSR